MSSMEELYNLDSHQNTNQWGIDKKIPLALIFVVIMQTVGITWSAATLSNNVKNTVERVETIEGDLKSLPDKFITQKEHTSIEDSARRELDDIKEDIEKLQRRVLHVERNLGSN